MVWLVPRLLGLHAWRLHLHAWPVVQRKLADVRVHQAQMGGEVSEESGMGGALCFTDLPDGKEMEDGTWMPTPAPASSSTPTRHHAPPYI